MKGYLLRTWALWGRGLILALLNVSLVALFTQSAYAQVRFVKTYGGTEDDRAYAVQQTSDGGYIVAGSTRSFGAGRHDIILVKTDANGNRIWAKTYGGTEDDRAYAVQQTSDGGYIVAGSTRSFSGGRDDIILVKTDANGNIIWAKTYEGTDDDMDRAYAVQQTSDGGYIVAGSTRSFGAGRHDIILVKTDANGNIGSCEIVQNVSPTVGTPSVTVTTPSLTVYSPSPTVTSPSPTVTSPTLTVSAPCPVSDDNELEISESCQPVSGIITPYKGGIKVSRSGEFEVKVYNVSGVMVKSIKGKDEVKLELSRGVYFVEVVSGDRVLRDKVIIR
jgi:TolB-like protein